MKTGARLYPEYPKISADAEPRLRSRRGRLGVFAGFGALLAICAVLAGCSSRQAKSAKASAPPPAVPVGVATVKQGDFNVYLTGLGSVQAFNTVSLKTRIDGQIMQVNFREGQDVKAGDLLILIDPRPYQVALATGQGQSAERRSAADQRQSAVRAQQGSVRAGRHRQAGPGHPGSVVRHLRRHHRRRQGGHRECQAEPDLLPHHFPDRRARGIAPGRSRQLRHRGQRYGDAGDHAAASHRGGVHAS